MVFRLELTRQILSAESIKLPPDSQNGQIDFYQTARGSKRTNIKQNEWKDGTENFKIICPLILPFIMIKFLSVHSSAKTLRGRRPGQQCEQLKSATKCRDYGLDNLNLLLYRCKIENVIQISIK